MRNGFILFSVFLFSFSALACEEEESFSTRRTMLQAHQLAGMATWALWLATNLEGERALDSLYRRSDEIARLQLINRPAYSNDPLYFLALQSPGRHSISAAYFLAKDPVANLPMYAALTRQDEWEASRSGGTHKGLAAATLGMYAVTASLAMFAPRGPKIENESGYSPTVLHKSMIPLHLLAMLALPTLGRSIEKEGPDAARRMQNVGWGGFGALSIAFFSMTF